MSKNIVICCDGTGNEIKTNLSNVLKLFRVLIKDENQRVFYHPGVGTIGLQSTWERLKQETYGVFSLATGAGLDEDILAAYRFLCQTYQDGDRVWLFGFSRGAYTVRVLAAFIHVIGLLPRDQIDLAGYALSVYKNASENSHGSDEKAEDFLDQAWQFRRVAGGYLIPIEFMGVWDTVASVIVPRQDKFLLDLQTLVYTRTNPSVKKFRQAMSIDERRRMFRLNRWVDPQKYRPDPFDASTAIAQDIRQVWFAGVHGDVGGGYPEIDSGLSKYPLLWMIAQAKAAGLRVDDSMVNHLGWGWPRPPSKHVYVPPSPTGQLHVSLSGLWWILEFLPKRKKWLEWPQRKSFLGWYIPDAEPRPIPGAPLTPIPEKPVIHRSVLDRMARDPSYRPINLPADYAIEEGPSPPVAGPAPVIPPTDLPPAA
ncbi:MAG TPA: DUF2235 domain-containing protein [Bradyrhizobium sp.]|uniref:DUF2235 domain-containing protein n=1 Tax=Bradyrhizobium sp. TaxID=376 RepID=UPI002C5F3DCB|nr:DUF2235 domain-containing protein [Bradyrhizobium sp.]HTB01147.1 DUF2235 domain-containing protein [Bradyrhizobium sp.]